MANAPPTGYIALPAVAAIGWIPFYFRLADVPANAYKDTRPRAYDILFDSGNRDPADNLVNEAGFRNILDTHDYRGALFLADLKIYRDAQRGFTHYNTSEFQRLESVGYTPLRSVPKDNPNTKEAWRSWPERRGIGGSNPERNNLQIDVQPDRVTVTQRVDFRLCRLLGLGGGIMTLTFRDAPYAWMATTLTLEADGSYQIQCSGSAVPSQKLYVDWLAPAQGTYDMIAASYNEMESFFRAGRFLGIGRTRRAPRVGVILVGGTNDHRLFAIRYSGRGSRTPPTAPLRCGTGPAGD
jgi:hypothetical protein